ncbi:MAG: CtsR family transcriptional regulator [Clostridia bacterium]|nr:CtsR family transcriptional regulator [Clostridia bacterium]
MLMTDIIANLIEELLEESNGNLQISRNELASRLGCVPSQINYVITSRFTPERGYVIESRRGGGGYLRIIKKDVGGSAYLMHMFASVGATLDERSAKALCAALYEHGYIDEARFKTCLAVLSGAALANVPADYKNVIRADIFRQVLMSIMK